MSGDGGSASSDRRQQITTSDPQWAEELIRRSYLVDNRLVFSGDPAGFEFTHDVVTAPDAGFTLNRLQHGMTIGYHTRPLDEVYSVNDVRDGRLGFEISTFGEVRLGPGDLALGAPDGDASYSTTDVDLRPVTLDRTGVADYATATCGLQADELAFTGLCPISPALARHWRLTVAHVRDDVLGNPFAAGSPIAVDSAFRSLVAALLSSFPNTALAAASDPGRPGVTGRVPAARVREVVDYLDSHADRPVGPADLADIAGMPAAAVVAGLRRDRDTDPARLLWTARLDGVRRHLRDADPATGVAAIAARWGFTDPARFRIAYRRAFGESPEQTLHH